MLKLEKVTKSFANTTAVNSLNLKIKSGETTVLIGPSGCGKSTILRLMIGLIKPDSGVVYFVDEKLTRDNIGNARLRMGYVIQDGGLFPHLTARDNITIMSKYLGWHKKEMDDRLLELTALSRFPETGLDRFPVQLSGGQKQRVSLMRALMLDPDILLLDEPLGALDPMIRSELQEDLRSIFKKLNKTVVMVTHDMAEAGFFGDKIVLLREGEVIQSGSFQEMLTSPKDPFVTRFINAQRSPLERLHESVR
ncbi:MAG: ATP-binding cassette domain-containing protein [Calditrichaceae bacterium]